MHSLYSNTCETGLTFGRLHVYELRILMTFIRLIYITYQQDMHLGPDSDVV
jgi:hypothetical protein